MLSQPRYATLQALDNLISQLSNKQTASVCWGGGGTIDNLDDLTHLSTLYSIALYSLPRSLDCDPLAVVDKPKLLSFAYGV